MSLCVQIQPQKILSLIQQFWTDTDIFTVKTTQQRKLFVSLTELIIE